ncbi:hypothetical protein LXL04_017233 [Taraxacum kok-saghyz]
MDYCVPYEVGLLNYMHFLIKGAIMVTRSSELIVVANKVGQIDMKIQMHCLAIVRTSLVLTDQLIILNMKELKKRI